MEEINVLITSCGRRVELVNEFKKARDKTGLKGKVITCDISNTAPAMKFADISVIVPRLNDSRYLEKLIEIIKVNNVKLVVPTIDTELQLLADNKEKIENETGAKVLISDSEVINICDNKINSYKYFINNGFSAPRIITDSDIEVGNYILPLFIKPKNGSSSINAYKIATTKELEFFRNYIEEPIIQEFVEGIEYTVDAFIGFDGSIISIVPRKRLQVRGGEILKGEIDLNLDIINNVEKLIKKLKPIGHITLQGFLCKNGEFKYIEINPRFGGGAPMSIKAGANSCEWLYLLLTGKTIDITKIHVENGAIFSRFDDCVRIK